MSDTSTLMLVSEFLLLPLPVIITSISSLEPLRVTFMFAFLLGESLVTTSIVEIFRFLSVEINMKRMLVDH